MDLKEQIQDLIDRMEKDKKNACCHGRAREISKIQAGLKMALDCVEGTLPKREG